MGMQRIESANKKSRIIEVAEQMMQLYFCENRKEEVAAYLGKGFSWIGVSEEEYMAGEVEAMQMFSGTYGRKRCNRLGDCEYHVQEIAEECYICTCRAWLTLTPATQMCLKTHLRISFFFRMEEDGPKCYHIHTSNPYAEDITEDFLTGVYNRRYVTRLIEEYLNKEIGCGFLLIDIDNFKIINDTYGHVVGDQVLARFSTLLKEIFSPYGVCGRLGGDEFIVFFPGNVTEGVAEVDSQKLRKRFADVLLEMQITISSGVSIGGICSGEKTTFEELYRKADAILYQVKENGKGSVMIESTGR